MREPNYQDFNEVAYEVNASDSDRLYTCIDRLGLPQEIAAHFYSYCAEGVAPVTTAWVQQQYAKAWR